LDYGACAAAFAANAWDNKLYEHAHRAFCRRVEAAGLSDHADVKEELAAAGLCGARDFSRLEDVCGPLGTAEGRGELARVKGNCVAARKKWRAGLGKKA